MIAECFCKYSIWIHFSSHFAPHRGVYASDKSKKFFHIKGQEANCQPLAGTLWGMWTPFFFMQQGQWVNVACSPLFLCWEVEHFPLHIYWQLYMKKLRVSWVVPTHDPTLCSSAWGWGGGVWDKTASFPRQEKETPSPIGLNGQSGYNRWTHVVGTMLLLYETYSPMRWCQVEENIAVDCQERSAG